MNDDVRQQYATSRNLAARGSFQGKYANVNWFAWLVDRMGIEPGANILDVGCGPAWFWRNQAGRLRDGLRLALIDTSEGMIDEAKANLAAVSDRLKDASFQVADAAALPFPDGDEGGGFDVVLLLHVLYHVNDPRQALSEARRVLRPGGRVFVSTNALDNMDELHAIGARAYGGEAVDPGAALFSIDDAERMVGELFADVRRHDLTDVMACTDPDDAVAVLLSMPPGNAAPPEERERLARLVREAAEQAGGTLAITRRNGLVEGTKSTAARGAARR